MYAYKIMYVLCLIYEWTILILHGCNFKYINDIALYMKYDERKGTSRDSHDCNFCLCNFNIGLEEVLLYLRSSRQTSTVVSLLFLCAVTVFL